ncbi:hypothetical protein [Chitinophaga alhagiae]|nr:hypothetical protein [Chitinophaga alhagiae]
MPRIIQNNIPLDFTCQNKRFETDINRGFEHRLGHLHRGSVTQSALYEDESSSLWLEHVIDKVNNTRCFWFMWYDANGNPKINASSVIDENDILEVIKNISQIRL